MKRRGNTPQFVGRNTGGFTLLELVIVMVIIVILAGVVVANFGPRTREARRTKAVADIKTLDMALETYNAHNGFYPTTQQGLDALLKPPSSPPVPRAWRGPYLKNYTSIPLDPWGNPYQYEAPGTHNPESFDIYSLGPTGQSGGTGDNAPVTPWDGQ